jgi:hypothetical protein
MRSDELCLLCTRNIYYLIVHCVMFVHFSNSNLIFTGLKTVLVTHDKNALVWQYQSTQPSIIALINTEGSCGGF